MNFLSIKNSADPYLIKIQILYEEAFPRRERRDFSELIKLMVQENMELTAIDDSSIFLGFFIRWEFKNFDYIEHLVIEPSLRGKNYGSAVVKKIIGDTGKVLLLEVEPAHDDISKKRILFYERLGMNICPFYYEQPPYRKNEQPFPMLIMSFPHALPKAVFEEYTLTIKEKIYERWR